MKAFNRGMMTFAGAALAATMFSAAAQAGEINWGKYQVGEIRSGYTYATKETRAMQDDDFVNIMCNINIQYIFNLLFL